MNLEKIVNENGFVFKNKTSETYKEKIDQYSGNLDFTHFIQLLHKTDIIVKELSGRYLGSRPSPDTKNACIAKTFVNIGGKTLSHFYINLPSGLIVDPATTFPKEEVNTKYKPVEFRWFEGGVI